MTAPQPKTLYTADFFDEQIDGSLASARLILGRIFGICRPTSVIDVGCGLGGWLRVALELGAQEVQGIDGAYIDVGQLLIEAPQFRPQDLEKILDIDKLYDLAICLEVAEHLTPPRASSFIDDLTSASDLVLFSAALRFQGGNGHLNEQWPEYWAMLFRRCGFVCFDLLRSDTWTDDVEPWYAQNTFLYVREGHDLAQTLSSYRADRAALTRVHPEIFLINIDRVRPDLHRQLDAEVQGWHQLVRSYASGEQTIPEIFLPREGKPGTDQQAYLRPTHDLPYTPSHEYLREQEQLGEELKRLATERGRLASELEAELEATRAEAFGRDVEARRVLQKCQEKLEEVSGERDRLLIVAQQLSAAQQRLHQAEAGQRVAVGRIQSLEREGGRLARRLRNANDELGRALERAEALAATAERLRGADEDAAELRTVVEGLRQPFHMRRMSRRRRLIRRLLPPMMRPHWDEWHLSRLHRIVQSSGMFDAEWYLRSYPEVAAAGRDPIRDYLETGAAAGRWPRPDFDPTRYAADHPILAFIGLDPFVDFVVNRDPARAPRRHGPAREAREPEHREPGLSSAAWREIHAINEAVLQHGQTVSIVIACYNYGRFVGEAVASATRQIYPYVDVVLVNDGSSDGRTPAICDALASDQVTVIHQSNQGLSAARNAGARATTSDFLLFLDADDLLEPYAITLMLWRLSREPETAFVYTDQRFFGDQNLIWRPQDYNAYDLLWANHPSVCSLIRRSAFEEVGGYSSGMVVGYEDWNHWLMLTARGHRGTRLSVPAFKHRRHGVTMTHEAHDRKRLLHAKLRQHSPELYTAAKITELKLEWRPSVSVLIPFFNAHRYIEETLRSVEAQTLQDYEIVIVDDGSTDPESGEILSRLQVRDERIRVVEGGRRGLPATRNRGVLEARSELIYFLDSDDLISPTALEKLVLAAALRPDKAFFYSSVRHFGAIEGVASDPFDAERLKRENFLAMSCLIRRDTYLQVGGMDEALLDSYEDYDFWLRLLSTGESGLLVPEILFHYRRHNAGNRTALEKKASPEQMYAILRARHPGLYGGPEPDRSSWRLIEPPAADESTSRIEALIEGGRLDGLPRESYRRPCLPNPFEPMRWAHGDKTRILYLVPHFVCGGAEQVDLDILQGFRDAGFELTVVACQDADHVWLDRFSAVASDCFVLQNLSGDVAGRKALLDYLLVSRAADVVFIRNAALGYDLCEQWQQVSPQVKFVDLLHLHAFGEDWVRRSAIYHDMLAARFVITEDLKDYATGRYRLNPDKFITIHNGVDPTGFPSSAELGQARREVRLDLGLDPDAPVVAFCGRVSDQKDPLRWLRIIGQALRLRPDLQPLVIGDGDLLPAMKAESERLGLSSRIRFLGYRDDARKLLTGCDVLLMTSRYEGLPQVILESLAGGAAVVATDVGGTREAVDASVGTLLDLSAEDDAFAGAVLHWCEALAADPDLRARCQRHVFDRFHVERQRKAYSEAVEAVAHGLRKDQRFTDYLDRVMTAPIIG